MRGAPRCAAVLAGHSAAVTCISTLPGDAGDPGDACNPGDTVVTGSSDGAARVWRLQPSGAGRETYVSKERAGQRVA